jgi:hypothetical protein
MCAARGAFGRFALEAGISEIERDWKLPKRRINALAHELPEFDRNVARAIIPFGPAGAPAAILAEKLKLNDGRSLIGALKRLEAAHIVVKLANRRWALTEKHYDLRSILALQDPAEQRASDLERRPATRHSRSPPDPSSPLPLRLLTWAHIIVVG